MTTATIVEKPISGAARMHLENREAEARAGTPLKTWTPAPLRPPPHPRVLELKAEADAVAARADTLTAQAMRTGQRIESLQREKTDLANQIAKIENRDLAAERVGATEAFNSKYGRNLSADEMHGLNQIVIFLSTLPTLERLTPPLVKSLKAKLAVVEKELAAVTGAQ